MLDWPLLSLVIWIPAVGAIAVAAAGRRSPDSARVLALIIALITFGLSLLLYVGFDTTTAQMQFVEKLVWIEAFDIHYHLGIDGISLPLILLNALICVIIVISSWRVSDRAHQYMATFLVLHALINGTFAALDILLFYVFFEFSLIPMYLIIGMWGGPNRIYATIKFFLYTFLGSVFL
ncbi:MAG TPA: proton-conducting transporter membrane subunit, partial [Wenzhouxiangella sp.]|nr:proton-conducting transporter membrane subunit [Wenzhouxiangella sp.]